MSLCHPFSNDAVFSRLTDLVSELKMRIVKYKIHWSYMGPGIKREAPLAEFILDIPYFIEAVGVIPPLHILNERMMSGGNSGGMGPGTTWRPFKVKPIEYEELVAALLAMDIAEARKEHFYVSFRHIIVDASFAQVATFDEWIVVVAAKYLHRNDLQSGV